MVVRESQKGGVAVKWLRELLDINIDFEKRAHDEMQRKASANRKNTFEEIEQQEFDLGQAFAEIHKI